MLMPDGRGLQKAKQVRMPLHRSCQHSRTGSRSLPWLTMAAFCPRLDARRGKRNAGQSVRSEWVIVCWELDWGGAWLVPCRELMDVES